MSSHSMSLFRAFILRYCQARSRQWLTTLRQWALNRCNQHSNYVLPGIFLRVSSDDLKLNIPKYYFLRLHLYNKILCSILATYWVSHCFPDSKILCSMLAKYWVSQCFLDSKILCSMLVTYWVSQCFLDSKILCSMLATYRVSQCFLVSKI